MFEVSLSRFSCSLQSLVALIKVPCRHFSGLCCLSLLPLGGPRVKADRLSSVRRKDILDVHCTDRVTVAAYRCIEKDNCTVNCERCLISSSLLKRRQSVFLLFIGFICSVIVVFCRCLCTCLRITEACRCHPTSDIQHISSRFFENQPNEICSHLSEKPSKGRFFKPDELQYHTNEGKGRRKRKSEEEEKRRREKSNGCTLSFYNGYFGDRFWPNKTVGRKRFIRLDI